MHERYCDNCGKKIERGDILKNFFSKDYGISNGIRAHVSYSFYEDPDSMYPLDLCSECGEKLLKEVKGGRL